MKCTDPGVPLSLCSTLQTDSSLYVMSIHTTHSIVLCVSQLKHWNYHRKNCAEACNNGLFFRNSSMCQRQRELLRGLDKYQGYLSLYCIQSQWACTEVLRHQACAMKLSVCRRLWHREATIELIMWKEGHLIARTQTVCGVNTVTIKEIVDWKPSW